MSEGSAVQRPTASTPVQSSRPSLQVNGSGAAGGGGGVGASVYAGKEKEGAAPGLSGLVEGRPDGSGVRAAGKEASVRQGEGIESEERWGASFMTQVG